MKTKYSEHFFKEVKSLRKKYQNLDQDLLNFVNQLEAKKIVADRIQGFGSLSIFKARIRNSSTNTGKSGGFRVIYYLQRRDGDECYFLTIYSKSLRRDISHLEILKILRQENLV